MLLQNHVGRKWFDISIQSIIQFFLKPVEMSITITSQFQKLNDDIMTCEKAIYLVKKNPLEASVE